VKTKASLQFSASPRARQWERIPHISFGPIAMIPGNLAGSVLELANEREFAQDACSANSVAEASSRRAARRYALRRRGPFWGGNRRTRSARSLDSLQSRAMARHHARARQAARPRAVLAMCERADAVIENARSRRGSTRSASATRRKSGAAPMIVLCSVTPFGPERPVGAIGVLPSHRAGARRPTCFQRARPTGAPGAARACRQLFSRGIEAALRGSSHGSRRTARCRAAHRRPRSRKAM